MDKNLQIIPDFIKKQNLRILSTINKGRLEAAVAESSQADNVGPIFDTFIDSRKAKNIRGNENVAVVTARDEGITVQYEGKASLLHGQELAKRKELYSAKIPSLKEIEGREEGLAYFKIRHAWMGYSGLNVHQRNIFEAEF